MFFVFCGSKENPSTQQQLIQKQLLVIRRRLQVLIWLQILWTSVYVCIISGVKCCILQYKTCTLESHFNYFLFFSAWNWFIGKLNVCFINTPNITRYWLKNLLITNWSVITFEITCCGIMVSSTNGALSTKVIF